MNVKDPDGIVFRQSHQGSERVAVLVQFLLDRVEGLLDDLVEPLATLVFGQKRMQDRSCNEL
ncbi:MAG: hypothetical protein M3Q75_03865 [Gemmatimonadota bacterium]|nr:hypothetical protein [Gemmatimonadota bacterium]